MTTFESFKPAIEQGQLYKNARAQQVENDRLCLERAEIHLNNIPPTNLRAIQLHKATIERLRKIVDGAWLQI